MSDYLKDGEAYRTLPNGTVVKIRHGDIWGDQGVMKSGERMHVPMVFMDSAANKNDDEKPTFDASAHMPRTLPMTDAQKAQHTAQMKRNEMRMNDAWKRPILPKLPAASAALALRVAPQTPTGMTDSQAAYERRNKRLQEAWRHANIKVSP